MQFLDADTQRQLDFDQVWSRIRPVSALGRALHRKATAFLLEQSADLQQEWDRLEGISSCLRTDPQMAAELIFLLSTVRDISGTVRRSIQGCVLDDLELYEVKKLLLTLEKVQAELDGLHWSTLLPTPLDFCTECKEALSIGQGSQESFYLADAYDQELADIRQERISLEGSLSRFRDSAEQKVLQAVGRILSMDDDITVSTTDGAMITQLDAIEELSKVQETSAFVTFRLVEDETLYQIRRELTRAREKEEECKNRIRQRLSEVVHAHGERLLRILEQLGFLDLLLAKAEFCAAINGIRPQLCPEPAIRIQGGRHLLLAEDVQHAGHDYTPLDIELESGVTMITGPNMGGKTASLQTIGLLLAMAQFGLLVPATSLEFRPRQFIAAHLAVAEIPKGLSTFAGEIAFLRDVIQEAHQDALILVDEIAHGTNPVEGAALAEAVVEKLDQKPSITVMTTHYPSLARLEAIRHLRVRGLDKDKLQKQLRVLWKGQADAFRRCMDYRLEVASPDQPLSSDAALVAEAMGLDKDIIERAKELLQLNAIVQREGGHG